MTEKILGKINCYEFVKSISNIYISIFNPIVNLLTLRITFYFNCSHYLLSTEYYFKWKPEKCRVDKQYT